jgi:hypothetical protein
VQNYALFASQEHAQQEPRLELTYTTTPVNAPELRVIVPALRW